MNSKIVLNDLLAKEKNDLHKSIDNSFNNILKSLEFIFKAMNYNEEQIIEEPNDLEIASSSSNISNEISSLLKTVNDMKVKIIKTYEIKQNQKEKRKAMYQKNSTINEKITLLQELHNTTANTIKEWKLKQSYQLMNHILLSKQENNN